MIRRQRLFSGIALAAACLLHGAPDPCAAQTAPAGPAPPAVAPDAPESPRAGAFGDVWLDPGTGIEFRRIPAGEFDMGSNALANERPVHRVRLGEFWLARTEVTQAQWRAVMGGKEPKRQSCDDCPATQVNWEDVQQFLKKTAYRLPTEAEWEYAAGGGEEHQRWAGTNDESALGEYAWYRGNSVNRPHPVGQKKPNIFGLFDMSGNVYEWCSDWYGASYYADSPPENPPGPATGTHRVARGGSWILDPRIAGVTFRLSCLPTRRRDYLGFRPALTAPPEPPPER